MRWLAPQTARSWLALWIALGLGAGPATVAGEYENTAEGVLVEFTTALDNLDLSRLLATVAADATMFFPQRDATKRLNGKAEIATAFERAFVGGRQLAERAGRTEPPFLGIVAAARDRRVQSMGDKVAVITWILDRPGNVGRRTAVVRREDDGFWRVVHLHASNLYSDE